MSNANTLNLESVWSEYQLAVKAFLHSKVSNPDDVDDLQQEILIKTHQNLSSIKDQSSVKSWLFLLASRTIIDFYRIRARQQRDGALEADELWFEEQQETAEQEMARCVEPFIQALPTQQSELLAAIEIQGISQKELAKVKGVSYSTLKSRVQKGRGELRKLLEQCCTLELDKYGNVIDYHQKSKGCRGC